MNRLMSNESNQSTRILAIESSCDETAAAIIEGDGQHLAVARSNVIASQVALHAQFGGVFPDLAAQEHTKKIIPVISLALYEAGLTSSATAKGQEIQQAIGKIDAIAVTVGPGLIGSLLIGTNAAAQLAFLSNKPILPINHWEGHLYSIFLQDKTGNRKLPEFPILTLTVSGGHTSLILIRNHFDYEILGTTVDDAAGEAFDKCARLLGLGYPGGPALSQAADRARAKNETLSIKLPRPMLDSGNLKFSFSGLKTAVLYAIERGDIQLPNQQDAGARETEDAIVDVLVAKTIQAAQEFQPKTLALVGGVSANKELRTRLTEATSKISLPLYVAPMPYTTDNAAMIGAAGLFRYTANPDFAQNPLDIEATSTLRL
jgi:N6-L-threonylcarbamoyladenine synthase